MYIVKFVEGIIIYPDRVNAFYEENIVRLTRMESGVMFNQTAISNLNSLIILVVRLIILQWNRQIHTI